MKQFFDGFADIFTPKGAGYLTAIFMVLVILQLVGHGDDDVAEDLRSIANRSHA